MRIIQIIKKKCIYTVNIDKIVSIDFDKENCDIKIYTVDNTVYIISFESKSFLVELFGANKLGEKESVEDQFTDIKELYDVIVDFVNVTFCEINKMVIDNS